MLQRKIGAWVLVCACLFCLALAAQQPAAQQQPAGPARESTAAVVAEPEAPRVVLQAETTAPVLRLMKFSGALRDRAGNPRTGAVGLTFALYKDQQGGSPLWLEVHNAQLDEQGRYTVLLGSTKSEGLPLELFSSGEARWLGVQLNLPGEEEQPRVLLVSVPYALKAADAETLGGKPPSAFLLAEKTETGEKVEAKPGAGKEAVKEGPGREQVVGTITGEGTLNMVSKFTGANAIGNGSIFDNGFVGIGTTSPSARLHIFEPEPSQNANVRLMGSGQTGSWMDIFAGTAVGFGLFGYGAQPFIFGTSGLERMRITPAGNVGIGTTSPGVRLHIFENEPSQNANVRLMGSGQTGAWMDIFSGTAVGHGLFGYGNFPFIFGAGGQERARITATGNMGIGNIAPSQKLDVGGGGRFTNTIAGGTGVAGFATGTGTTYAGYFQSDSTSGRGVIGYATAGGGATYGAIGKSDSPSGQGVFGWATAADGTTYGVYGQSDSPSGYGVYSQGNAFVAGNLTVSGGIGINGSVIIPTTTRYLAIPCAAFNPTNAFFAFVKCDTDGQISGTNPGDGAVFDAPVLLPHGANITEIRIVVNDNDAGNITVWLFRTEGFGTGGVTQLANFSSSGTPGLTTLTSSVSHTVDNSTGSYHLRVSWIVPATPANLKTYSARITYTITTPLP